MSFTQVQRSLLIQSGSLALPAASGQGTLLVAVVASTALAPAATMQQSFFTPPAGAWQFALGVQSAAARLEIWWMPNNPGAITAATFSVTGGTIAQGFIYEFASPQGTTQILHTAGQVGAGSNSGGTNIAVPSASGVFAGSMGLFVQSVQFSSQASTGMSYTIPAGYTANGGVTTGVKITQSNDFNGNLAAGYQLLAGGFPYTGNGTTIIPAGYAGLFVVFRSTVFAPTGIEGAEPTNCLDLDPTGQQLLVGGDVEGCWTSADFGNNWQPSNYGFFTGDQVCFSSIVWSLIQPGYAYASCGKGDSGGSGFYSSTDGGCTWTPVNTTPLKFYGNASPSPPRASTRNQDEDRATGQNIAQDTVSDNLFVIDSLLGVSRSPDFGVTWTSIGLHAANQFPRCILANPNNSGEMWVGVWGYGGFGGIYHTTNANAVPASNVNWTQLPGYQGTVTCMCLLGSFLYASGHTSGIFRANVSNPLSQGSLTSLNASTPTAVDTTVSLWTTIDGWVDNSGNHNVVAGCSLGVHTGTNFTNVIQLHIPVGGPPAIYTDLTGNNTINISTIPPNNQPWWNAGNANWHFWLGGKDSVNPHILVDPVYAAAHPGAAQRIYLSNSGGFFRSLDGGNTWQLAVNGMPMIGVHAWVPDPNTGSVTAGKDHIVTTGDDFCSLDLTDPTGNTANSINGTGTGALGTGNNESHGAAFDPIDSRFWLGVNAKYSKPTGGDVQYRSPGSPFTWTGTSYPAQVTGAPAVIGLATTRDGANRRVVVACAQGVGLYRWRGDQPNTWTQVDSTVSVSGVTGQTVIFAVDNVDASLMYVYDRQNGVLSSSDYGVTWHMRWKKKTTNKQTGYIAAHPTNTGELWVGADSGLYQLTGLQTGTGIIPSGQVNQTLGKFSAGASGVAFGPNGFLYVIAVGGNSPAPAVPTLYVSSDGGSTFSDATNGDGSFASYCAPAAQMAISPLGYILVQSGEHAGAWAQFSSGGVMSVAGLGTVTASTVPTHTLASVGAGHVTTAAVERAVLSVAGAGSVTLGQTPPPPMITTTTLPSGTVGVVY